MTADSWRFCEDMHIRLTSLDLGSFLVEKKNITETQLQECVRLHRHKGGYLSQYFIDRGYVKDSDLTTYLTCYYGYCYLPLKSYHIAESTLKAIPAHLAQDFCIVPIEQNDKLLSVIMADPLNRGVIEILRHITSCEIIVFVSTRTEISETIEKNYSVPYKNFEFCAFDDDIILRDDFLNSYVSSGLYEGPNRRKFRRHCGELTAVYYLYPNIARTKVLNIGMSGVFFETDTPLPQGSHLAIDIFLNRSVTITVVAEIARSDIKRTHESSAAQGGRLIYETGAFFNFMTCQNQKTLADFLRIKLHER